MASEDIHYLILPHVTEPSVLLLQGRQGWELPRVQTTPPLGDYRWRYVNGVNERIRQQFGLNTTVLRYADLKEDSVTRQLEGICVVESHDPGWSPPKAGRWIGRVELDTLPIAAPAHRSLLEAWFAEPAGGSFSSLRQPWMQPGWFAKAAGWIYNQMAAKRIIATATAEQTRSWFISCILRVPTASGSAWFKATPPHGSYEPPLTQALAAEYPHMLPSVLAVDIEQGWLLTQGIEGVRLDRHPDRARYLPRWEELLRGLAQLQRDYAERIPQLLAWGCPDWRPETLASKIEPFVSNLAARLRASGDLTDAQADEASTLIPQIKRICNRLENYGVPSSFTHWDFHSGNILANSAECKVIDWTGGIAHPFTALSVVFEEHQDPAIRGRLREIYLEPWTTYAPIERLVEASELALTLAALQNVMGHFESLQHAEMPWEREADRGNLIWYLKYLKNCAGRITDRA